MGILVFSFSQYQQPEDDAALLKLYTDADKLQQEGGQLLIKASYDEKVKEKADNLYQQALSQFKTLSAKIKTPGNDSLAFFIYLKTGIIESYFKRIDAARQNYFSAIEAKRKIASVPDSFLLSPLLYIGTSYYNNGQYDSAFIYYKKAEQVNNRYQQPLTESQVLYSQFALLHTDIGNYRQARAYYEKTIALPFNNIRDIFFLTTRKLRIADLSMKLEEYEEAKTLYESILPYSIFNDEANYNLGIINIGLKDYPKAISYLRQVNQKPSKKNIDLYSRFGVAFAAAGEPDSAELYFHKALAENLKWNGHKKNIAYGLILKYQGDELAKHQYYKLAANNYQEAIVQFYPGYTDFNFSKNPEQYSGIFSYINLFNTLTAKAITLENYYKGEKDVLMLESSLDAYRSAYRLIDYVEKNYNSDEAVLFLSKIKNIVHTKPIDISLLLFNLTKRRNYLEEAYSFDQRNKNSVVALISSENEPANSNELLKKREVLKSTVTRLSVKANETEDSTVLFKLNSFVLNAEAESTQLDEEIKLEPLLQKKLINPIPTVSQLQRKLDNTTAILSFHLSENELLALLITADQFEYRSTVINKGFFSEIESFKDALQNKPADDIYTGANSAMNLYQAIISPVHSKLIKIKKLVIIPDGELNCLPFEALQDENRKYILEKFSVQYQYSTALLGKDGTKLEPSNTLAFAPYTTHQSLATGNLPFSEQEIKLLQGKTFVDSAATKSVFLQSAIHYNIIHLSTHSFFDNNNPSQSHIVFNPANNDYKLTAQEIHNLNLDSTQLIILNGSGPKTGKMGNGEGLMSLSRSFAYAGCPNMITSLWRAEDSITTFITKRLHFYLSENISKDKALQQAKLDLLHSPDIDPHFKTPAYWANLIFIGNYEPDHKRNNWKWVAIGIVVILVGYEYAKKKDLKLFRRRKKTAA
jgi:CHAT domain-containing protein